MTHLFAAAIAFATGYLAAHHINTTRRRQAARNAHPSAQIPYLQIQHGHINGTPPALTVIEGGRRHG